MPISPFKLYLENKKISKNTANLRRDIFEDQCKREWNNMPNKAKLFWINYAFEQETKLQEKIKNSKTSSCKSILTKKKQPLRISMANCKLEKPATSANIYHPETMEIKIKPKEKSSQCCQDCKLEQKSENDDIIKILPSFKLDKNRIIRKKGEASKDKMKRNGPIFTIEQNDYLVNGPEIPPACAFYLFMKNYNDLYPHSDDAIYVWRKLSHDDRNFYRSLLRGMRKQYAIDYKNFLEGNNLDKVEKYILNSDNTHNNYLDQADMS